MYRFKGIINDVSKPETITHKAGEFQKQKVLLTDTSNNFDNVYQFEVFGEENITILKDKLKVNKHVLIDFYIKSREWRGKYYYSLVIKSVLNTEDNIQADPF